MPCTVCHKSNFHSLSACDRYYQYMIDWKMLNQYSWQHWHAVNDNVIPLPVRYMKYLYPYECEKRGLSSPGELQAAIDSNRREGRRQSYGSAIFNYSPVGTPTLMSSPKMHMPHLPMSSHNGGHISQSPVIKKGELALPASCHVTRGSVSWAHCFSKVIYCILLVTGLKGSYNTYLITSLEQEHVTVLVTLLWHYLGKSNCFLHSHNMLVMV